MPLFGPNIVKMKQNGDITGLVKLLKSQDVRTRSEAIKALGELRARAAIPTLLEILLTPTAAIAELIAVAEALGAIGDGAAIDGLVKASAISRERERAQINATATERDSAYQHSVYINLISTEEFTFRRALAEALGRIGGVGASAALFEMLGAETGPMEGSASNAIRSALNQVLNGDEKITILRSGLEHASPVVREWAVQSIRDVEDAGLQDYLIAMAWDEQQPFTLRQSAVGTLGQIGDERAMGEMEELSKSPQRALARDAHHSSVLIHQRLENARRR